MHRVDSLELVQDMILAGLGVGLLPAGRPVRRGVALRPLSQPDVTQRPFAVTRRGRSAWPPLALVLRLLQEISGLTGPVISRGPGHAGTACMASASRVTDRSRPSMVGAWWTTITSSTSVRRMKPSR
jgi:hypothetical protein